MDKTLKRFLLPALLILALAGCGPETESHDPIVVGEHVDRWLTAINDSDWEALAASYADTVSLNGTPFLASRLIEEKRAFLESQQPMRLVLMPETWTMDTSFGEQVLGHLKFQTLSQGEGLVVGGQVLLMLHRIPNGGGYEIVDEDDNIAQSFAEIKNELRQLRLGEGPFGGDEMQPNPDYWKARIADLKGPHDKVFAFTVKNGKEYFWVAKGTEDRYYDLQNLVDAEAPEVKCGLLDQEGATLIPLEYDFLGCVDAIAPGLVEVFQDGKVGLYTLEGKQVAPATYDRILPLGADKMPYVAWLGKAGQYFGLTADLELKALEMDANAFGTALRNLKLESFFTSGVAQPGAPHPWLDDSYFEGSWNQGTLGILITPNFLQAYKGFPKASLLSFDYNHQLPMLTIQDVKPVGDDKLGILALFDYWGAGGRDVYHATDKRMFTVDAPRAQQIAEVELEDRQVGYTCSLISLGFVSENILESVEMKEIEGYHEFPVYTYYTVDANGSLSPRNSHRKFPFTEYYELTDAFFKGCFEKVDPKYKATQDPEEMAWLGYNHDPGIVMSHLPFSELELMRNEILAEYGQTFEGKWKDHFAKQDWYKPMDGSASDRMNERDRHNVEFIDSYLTRMAGKEKQLMFPNEKAEG